MSRRTVYTIITPLPASLSRETVLAALHDHSLMIELNPLVLSHKPVKPPRFAPADEYYSPWYEITDRVHYLPGGLLAGKVVYHAVCHDIPTGLQTHCYAPMGVDIKGKWLLKGSLPGEPPEPKELGVAVPSVGLYIREDIDMKCNFMMNKLVKKQLHDAHKTLLERILVGADLVEGQANRRNSKGAGMAQIQQAGFTPYAVDHAVIELPSERQDPVELPAGPAFVPGTTAQMPPPPPPPQYNSYSPYTSPKLDAAVTVADVKSVSGSGSSRGTSSPPNVSTHPHRPQHSPQGSPLPSYDQQQQLRPLSGNVSPQPGAGQPQPRPLSGGSDTHPQQQWPYSGTINPELSFDQNPPRSPTFQHPHPSPTFAAPAPSPALQQETPALQRFRQSMQRGGSSGGG